MVSTRSFMLTSAGVWQALSPPSRPASSMTWHMHIRR